MQIPPLAEDDLVVKWSGPVFFNIYGAGAGSVDLARLRSENHTVERHLRCKSAGVSCANSHRSLLAAHSSRHAASVSLCGCAGVGLTLGVAEIDSIIVLDSQKAVDAFVKSQVIMHRAGVALPLPGGFGTDVVLQQMSTSRLREVHLRYL